MSHSNTLTDFESAPVPASGLPTHEIEPAELPRTYTKDEKYDNDHDTIIVGGAVQVLEGDEPTDEEYNTLRKVPAKMSWTVIAMCLLELAERASYYGVQGCFANFVRGPLPDGGNGAGAVAKGPQGVNQSAGALGMGSVAATATGQTFTFLAYVIPILGGILADTKWGRFKTIAVGTAVGAFAHVLLVVPAIPSVISSGHAYIPFIISVIILAFASGFIKPCVAPMLCDQSPVKRPTLQTLKSGERVVVDPQSTVGRYMLIFYWCINVGSFYGIASTYCERLIGFWLAFLIPGILYMLMPIVLFWGYKRLYRATPQGSVVLETIYVFRELFQRGGFKKMFKGGDEFWNLAKPSQITAQDGTLDERRVFWDDQFVDEIRQSLAACAVFFLIPIFLLADNGIGNQLNDMSAAMTLNSIPNDIMSNFNPLAIIVATPILTYGLYPFCEKMGFPLRPMTRMSIGFLLATVEMIICAIIQKKIYDTSPCGDHATTCDTVSPVNLAWQIPIYVIPAVGELFVMVTSYELAYTRAPARMKGLVYAICLFSNAIPAAIGLALSNVIQDPNLVIPYYVLAGATFVCAFLFPTVFRHLNEPIKVFAEVSRMEGKQQVSKLEEGPSDHDEKRITA